MLTVEVDRSRCVAIDADVDARLTDLEAGGLVTSVAQLVGDASVHCVGAVEDRGQGRSAAEIELAWNVLRDWNPTARARGEGSEPTLVVAEQHASRFTAIRVEAMAMGLGLRVATHLYGLRRQLWTPSPGLSRHDLQAFNARGELVRVEARGRSNRSNRNQAVEQVHKKFATADFARAAGVIWFVRTDVRSDGKDLLVIDPTGVPMSHRAHEQFRSVLAHYAPFFEAQGGAIRRFGTRLREIADASDADFGEYLASGDSTLNDPRTWPNRTQFRWKDAEFKGTAWEGVAWPKTLTGIDPPTNGGCFYWGLWTGVIDALKAGDVAAVAEMTVTPAVVREPDRMFILMEDGTALAWAPSAAQLKPSLFEPDVAAMAR